MKKTPRIALALLFTLALTQFLAGENGPAISLDEYRGRLSQFASKTDLLNDHPEQASQLVTEIPDQLNVNTGARAITVNLRDLKNDLTSLSSADDSKKPERLLQIRDYLGELQLAAANLSTIEPKGEQQKLNEILARREFHKVRGPGWREAFLAKLNRWLARWLVKFRVGSGATNRALQGLVYTLVGLAVLLMLIWTVRSLRRREPDLLPREIVPFAPSAKSWRTWLAEARQAAEMQDWRNAIHLAYWAGISALESGGAWKPNRARTPREYLRMLGTRNPHHPALSALTRKFEVVWYGERAAAEADFQETLAQLEHLGCR
jgi:Domain of unknown function (DUF4129)